MSNGEYIPPILKRKGFVDITCESPSGLGASSVYKVRRPGIGDWIVKRIEKDHAILYKAEKNVLTTLRHDFLPIVFDVFEDDQALYIAMEFIPGNNLQTLIQNRTIISETAARKYFLQLCELFEFLHRKNVIHKDCKPSNIMLSTQDNMHLIDFGISKSKGNNPRGVTQGYAAPEQTENPDMDDPRVDIFALGATMFSLITGETPPATAADAKILQKSLNNRKDISAKFKDVIIKCMATNPARRYQTVTDVKNAVAKNDFVKKAILSVVAMVLCATVVFFGMSIWHEEATDRLIIRGNDFTESGMYDTAMQYFELYITRRPLSAVGYERRRDLLISTGNAAEGLQFFSQTESTHFSYFIESSQEFRNTWARTIDINIEQMYNAQRWHELLALLATDHAQAVVSVPQSTNIQAHVYLDMRDTTRALAYFKQLLDMQWDGAYVTLLQSMLSGAAIAGELNSPYRYTFLMRAYELAPSYSSAVYASIRDTIFTDFFIMASREFSDENFYQTVRIVSNALTAHPYFYERFDLLYLRAIAEFNHLMSIGAIDFSSFVRFAHSAMEVAGAENEMLAKELGTVIETLGFPREDDY